MMLKFTVFLSVLSLFLFEKMGFCAGTPEKDPEVLYTKEQYTELFTGMLHKPYPEKTDHIHYLYSGIINQTDSLAVLDTLERYRAIATRAADQELQLETDLLGAYYRVRNGNQSMEQKVSLMQAVGDIAIRKQVWHIHLRALKVIGDVYWGYLQYERAFETYFQITEILDRLDPADFPDKARYLSNIGETLYYFQDYRQAINLFERALAIPETDFNALDITRSRNNLGLSYQKLGQLEQSSRYFREIIGNRQSKGWEVWEGIAHGNLGYNYYLGGEYDNAVPYLQYDIEKAIATEDFGLAVGSLTPLADIRIKQNRLELAGEHVRLAREYVDLTGQYDRLRLLYPVISKWHAARGDSELAAAYVDSTIQAMDAYNEKFNSIKLMRAQQKNDLQQRQLLLAEKQQQLQERNLVILIILLLFAGSLASYVFRNRYLLRKQQIKDLELEHARTQLENFTRRIKENNKLITHLQKNGGNPPEQQKVLQRLKSSSLLTDDDWIKFKQLFEEVHPGYLNRIKDAYPGLTPSEIRYLVLEKLKFTRKEMANVLGISPESLRVTWHRIRKKLDLQDETSASQLASMV